MGFDDRFSVAPSWAEQPANTEEIQPVKTFSPPKPIAPTAAQGYFPKTNSTAPTAAIITLLPKT